MAPLVMYHNNSRSRSRLQNNENANACMAKTARSDTFLELKVSDDAQVGLTLPPRQTELHCEPLLKGHPGASPYPLENTIKHLRPRPPFVKQVSLRDPGPSSASTW